MNLSAIVLLLNELQPRFGLHTHLITQLYTLSAIADAGGKIPSPRLMDIDLTRLRETGWRALTGIEDRCSRSPNRPTYGKPKDIAKQTAAQHKIDRITRALAHHTRPVIVTVFPEHCVQRVWTMFTTLALLVVAGDEQGAMTVASAIETALIAPSATPTIATQAQPA